jgi:hypothetical protein
MAIDLDAYNTVPERITEFRTKHPEGSLQQVGIEFIRDFGGGDWIVYTAAALRAPDDAAPGHGTAWERVPGLTPYTKNSELQNAETSAWGRAIVATLAADTAKIASRTDVENRAAEKDIKEPEGWRDRIKKATDVAELSNIHEEAATGGWATPDVMAALTARKGEL